MWIPTGRIVVTLRPALAGQITTLLTVVNQDAVQLALTGGLCLAEGSV
jgi:hypothetical protein